MFKFTLFKLIHVPLIESFEHGEWKKVLCSTAELTNLQISLSQGHDVHIETSCVFFLLSITFQWNLL